MWAPTVNLFRWLLFVDHVDLAAPRAQTRWTRARPRKRTTQSLAKPPQRMPTLRRVRALTSRLRGEADVAGK